jgi:hypothetical protein
MCTGKRSKKNTFSSQVFHTMLIDYCQFKTIVAVAVFALTQEWKELESCSFHDYADKSVLCLFINRCWKVLQIQNLLINNFSRSSLQFFQILYEQGVRVMVWVGLSSYNRHPHPHPFEIGFRCFSSTESLIKAFLLINNCYSAKVVWKMLRFVTFFKINKSRKCVHLFR